MIVAGQHKVVVTPDLQNFVVGSCQSVVAEFVKIVDCVGQNAGVSAGHSAAVMNSAVALESDCIGADVIWVAEFDWVLADDVAAIVVGINVDEIVVV